MHVLVKYFFIFYFILHVSNLINNIPLQWTFSKYISKYKKFKTFNYDNYDWFQDALRNLIKDCN